MNNENIEVNIDEFGQMYIPNDLRHKLKPNMILTFLGSDTLVAIPLDRLNSIGSNLPKSERRNLLRVLKANSTKLVLDQDYKVNIPENILEKIGFREGTVIFNEEGNFKIVDSRLIKGMEVRTKYGK